MLVIVSPSWLAEIVDFALSARALGGCSEAARRLLGPASVVPRVASISLRLTPLPCRAVPCRVDAYVHVPSSARPVPVLYTARKKHGVRLVNNLPGPNRTVLWGVRFLGYGHRTFNMGSIGRTPYRTDRTLAGTVGPGKYLTGSLGTVGTVFLTVYFRRLVFL